MLLGQCDEALFVSEKAGCHNERIVLLVPHPLTLADEGPALESRIRLRSTTFKFSSIFTIKDLQAALDLSVT